MLKVAGELARQGMTLIMVTHEVAFAREVADKLVFMHQGKVHGDGATQGAVRGAETQELRQFFGALL